MGGDGEGVLYAVCQRRAKCIKETHSGNLKVNAQKSCFLCSKLHHFIVLKSLLGLLENVR